MNKPLLSVCTITYNHESYIAQTIEGALMQKTNFPVEIIVGDDCSTDRTLEICQNYKENYPDIIKLLLPEHNLGMMLNFVETLRACSGKYIALCEGDDFWTDPDKLQKQVDFLEANPDYVACGHETAVMCYLTEPPTRTTFSEWLKLQPKNSYSGSEIIASDMPFHTSALVFRNLIDFDEKVRNIFTQALLGDNTLFAFLGNLGNIYSFNDTMSVYNMRNSGIAANLHGYRLILNYKNIIKTYNKINRYFNKTNQQSFNLAILKYFDKMMFNRTLYKNKWIFIGDALTFIFTGRYGKKPFLSKVKYIIKTL